MKSGPIATARPRGVRSGERYALGRLLVERTGGDYDTVIATCASAEAAKASAEKHNRKRGVPRRSKR